MKRNPINKEEVHGHPVPSSLKDFLDAGRVIKLDSDIINRAFGVEVAPYMSASWDSVSSETAALLRLQSDSELAPAYGLRPGAKLEEGFVDANLLLCIAANYDEEGLCLFYADSSREPSVLVSEGDDHRLKWRMIAKDFAEFLTLYRENKSIHTTVKRRGRS